MCSASNVRPPDRPGALVPTTLQRIEFTADQITRERAGVVITGIAVYRIAEPLLAFRVLDFTYGEAASEKLGATLREMFIGAARRLVANLSLDQCLTRRKETIAGYLIQEIAPVVSGEGSIGGRSTPPTARPAPRPRAQLRPRDTGARLISSASPHHPCSHHRPRDTGARLSQPPRITRNTPCAVATGVLRSACQASMRTLVTRRPCRVTMPRACVSTAAPERR
jgi:hypothetical protein